MQFKHISFVTDKSTWLNHYLKDFISTLAQYCQKISWVHDFKQVTSSDVVFYLSYSKIVPKKYLDMHQHNLVVHGSALPAGKGWSPLTWQILAGENDIPMTLFEADATLDSGQIYLQEWMHFEGHELIDEMRNVQAASTCHLCLQFIRDYAAVVRAAKKQVGEESFYPKRSTCDSQLCMEKTLADQFNLLRVVDNDKYPAYFNYLGHTYQLKIKKS